MSINAMFDLEAHNNWAESPQLNPLSSVTEYFGKREIASCSKQGDFTQNRQRDIAILQRREPTGEPACQCSSL